MKRICTFKKNIKRAKTGGKKVEISVRDCRSKLLVVVTTHTHTQIYMWLLGVRNPVHFRLVRGYATVRTTLERLVV